MTFMVVVILLSMTTTSMGTLEMKGLFFDMTMMSIKGSLTFTSMVFFLSICFISFSIFLWSLSYMDKYKSAMFYTAVAGFIFSMLMLTLSDSLFLVFLGWEGLGVTSFILIIFYQNWMSFKGGVLTLLTNRTGDAIFLIALGSFLLFSLGELEKGHSLLSAIMMLTLALTKSAQWPFVSWLPAAMAAPTPVSSLVHSSTLVTAGVWLMIRFMYVSTYSMNIWGLLGMLTLLVASLSALLEKDAKKVVALSTLSQLGLMFVALSISAPAVCFFHVIMHAFAKANLFMIIGGLLHSSFSQQDSRLIMSTTMSFVLTTTLGVSLLSLVGFTFTAGYFSKEQIIMSQPFIFNSLGSFLLLISITGLTLSYCGKLFFSLLWSSSSSFFQSSMTSLTQILPITFMSTLSILSGMIFSMNLYPVFLLSSSLESSFWKMMMLGISLLLGKKALYTNISMGFLSQAKMIDFGLLVFLAKKTSIISMESSHTESFFLTSSFLMIKLIKQTMRITFMFSLLSLIYMFL